MISFSGHLQLRAAHRGGRTTLAEQSFRAPFHVSKPYWDADARTLLVQIVNPTAGILSGDRLESEITVGAEAAVLVTSPSATRVFKMTRGSAECHQRFSVAAQGWLESSPEPLVPHRGCRYRQSTQIDLEPSAGLFYVDQLLPGRVGHGEAWLWDQLCLSLALRIGGQLALRERFDQSGAALRQLAEFAGSGATACFANAVLIAPALGPTPAWLARAAALHATGTWVGVSTLRLGGWSIKIVAPNPIQLRETVRQLREAIAAELPALTCSPRRF